MIRVKSLIAAVAITAVPAFAAAQTPSTVDQAVTILEQQMAKSDAERIPLTLRHAARCVAVFPSVVKAGVILAGKRGNGVVSCRDAATGAWGAPAYYTVTEASIGLQAGVQNASLLLLIVDDKGVERLLDEKLAFGGDVGIAIGPLGAAKQVNIDSSVVSYARSEGVFAGAQLGSSSVSYDRAATKAAYGADIDPEDLLFELGRPVPEEFARLHETLTRFAPPKKG